jgi:hypothetical protein
MASGNLTITAPVGPGDTVTSLVLNGVKSIKFDMANEVIEVVKDDGQILYFEYETIATVTYSISGEVATIAVST